MPKPYRRGASPDLHGANDAIRWVPGDVTRTNAHIKALSLRWPPGSASCTSADGAPPPIPLCAPTGRAANTRPSGVIGPLRHVVTPPPGVAACKTTASSRGGGEGAGGTQGSPLWGQVVDLLSDNTGEGPTTPAVGRELFAQDNPSRSQGGQWTQRPFKRPEGLTHIGVRKRLITHEPC